MVKNRGFTLIELMIIVIIIGILASIGYPAYQQNVMKSARGDGKTALLDVMRAQENYFANEYTYTDDLTNLNYDATALSSSGRFSITAGKCTTGGLTECVKLTATAKGGQVDDGDLTLNSKGERTHKGNPGWPK